MKIKIIKCDNPTAWYYDQIGKIFEVYKSTILDKEVYVVLATKETAFSLLIKPENCEIILEDKQF